MPRAFPFITKVHIIGASMSEPHVPIVLNVAPFLILVPLLYVGRYLYHIIPVYIHAHTCRAQ